MKKLLICGVLISALAACTTAEQARVSAVALTINGQVAKACAVFKPVAADVAVLYTLSPQVDAAIDGVNALCVANGAINPASVQTLVNTTLPAAVKALASVPGLSPAQTAQIGGVLTLVNATLALGLQTYAPAQ